MRILLLLIAFAGPAAGQATIPLFPYQQYQGYPLDTFMHDFLEQHRLDESLRLYDMEKDNDRMEREWHGTFGGSVLDQLEMEDDDLY